MHGRNLFDPTNTQYLFALLISSVLSRDSSRSFQCPSFTLTFWLPNLILFRALASYSSRTIFVRKDVDCRYTFQSLLRMKDNTQPLVESGESFPPPTTRPETRHCYPISGAVDSVLGTGLTRVLLQGPRSAIRGFARLIPSTCCSSVLDRLWTFVNKH